MTELGRNDQRAKILNRLGDISRKTGEVTDSEAFFSEALPLAREAGDPSTEVDILNNSGLLMSSQSRWEEAIEQLSNAVPLAQRVESLDVESALHHNIAGAWARLGEPQRAIESYERSLALKRKMGSARRFARTLESIAGVRFSTGDETQAFADARESLKLFEQSGDRAGMATSLTLLGKMSAGNDDATAIDAYSRALPIAREINDRQQEAQILLSWARIDVSAGRVDEALERTGRAVSLSNEISNRPVEAEALYVQATAFRAGSRLVEARGAIEAALAIVDSMRNTIARGDLRSSYLATVRRYYDFAIDLLLEEGTTASVAESFRVSERARARTLLAGLAESAARIRKGVDVALLDRERRLRSELNARETYRARVAGQDGEQSKRAIEISRDVERLLEEWRETQAEIRVSSPRYSSLALPEAIDIGDLQKALLDSSTALVSYRLGTPNSHAWVVDRGSITVHELPSSSVIDGRARSYHALLGRSRNAMPVAEREKLDGQLAQHGRRLAASVYDPIAARVRGKRLIVVADGALHYVPFAALPANGEPLLTRHEIVYLPTASLLTMLRRDDRAITASSKVAVFADPVFTRDDPRLDGQTVALASAREPERWRGSGAYSRLRFSRQEADAISGAAPTGQTFAALDFDAAKKTLLARDLRGYDILHFATHGILNTTQPELSGLVLSLFDQKGRRIDGFLRLHEIYNLDLDASLVVLSACETALGKEAHGEGLIGLTRGFMYAGAPRVVSSIWKVDDRASALLMTRFYEQMYEKGLSPSAALREAQLSMLREPRWRNAHHWAAFALHGDWE